MSDIFVTNVSATDAATGTPVGGYDAPRGNLDAHGLAVQAHGSGLDRQATYVIVMFDRETKITRKTCRWLGNDGTYDQFTVA